MKVNGDWRYVYRAVDQHDQVMDVYVSKKRDIVAARKFFADEFVAHGLPVGIGDLVDPEPIEVTHR